MGLGPGVPMGRYGAGACLGDCDLRRSSGRETVGNDRGREPVAGEPLPSVTGVGLGGPVDRSRRCGGAVRHRSWAGRGASVPAHQWTVHRPRARTVLRKKDESPLGDPEAGTQPGGQLTCRGGGTSPCDAGGIDGMGTCTKEPAEVGASSKHHKTKRCVGQSERHPGSDSPQIPSKAPLRLVAVSEIENSWTTRVGT